MNRCPIDKSCLFDDGDGRVLCLSAGHIVSDQVGLLQKMLSNSTPEDSDNVRPDSPRQYPVVDVVWGVRYTSPIRDETSDAALGHRHSEKLIGSADS